MTKGTPKVYKSSRHGRRHFCPDCGTGIFYINDEMLPEIVDIQSATYDDPNVVPPQAHIQVADRIGWMEIDATTNFAGFERFPPQIVNLDVARRTAAEPPARSPPKSSPPP